MDTDQKKDRRSKLRRDKQNKDHKRSHQGNADASSKPREMNHPARVVQASASTAANDSDATEADVKNYSKRQISSNWLKYEVSMPSVLPHDPVSQAADFATLLEAPLSLGGHFQFKQERAWDSTWQSNDLFNIDLKQLSDRLSCIAFYKQASLVHSCFSEDELREMDQEAERTANSYKKHLSKQSKEQEVLLADRTKSINVKVIPVLSSSEISPVAGITPQGDAPLLPASTELEASLHTVVAAVASTNDKEENLEDWLDSILDN